MQIFPEQEGLASFMPENQNNSNLSIENHDIKAKETNTSRFQCPYDGCARTYSNHGNLRAHLKAHRGNFM